LASALFVFSRYSAKPSAGLSDSPRMNLLHMMPAVYEVKFSPLRRGERSERGMIHEFACGSEFFLTSGQELVHLGDLGTDSSQYLLHGESTRPRNGGRFPSRGHITETQYHQFPPPMDPCGRGDQRASPFESALAASDGPGIGQIQMLENLRDTPLPSRRVAAHEFWRDAFHRGIDLVS